MTKPTPFLSGHCRTEAQTSSPEAAHARCHLDGCECPRHVVAPVPDGQATIDDVLADLPDGFLEQRHAVIQAQVASQMQEGTVVRPRVSLRCLQLAHADCKGYHRGDLNADVTASPCGCPDPFHQTGRADPVTSEISWSDDARANLETIVLADVIGPSPHDELVREITRREGQRLAEEHIVYDGTVMLEAGHNHAFQRDAHGILRCRGCGGHIDPSPPPAGRFVIDEPVDKIPNTVPAVELTGEERRQIAAAWLSYDVAAGYDAVVAILEGRLR